MSSVLFPKTGKRSRPSVDRASEEVASWCARLPVRGLHAEGARLSDPVGGRRPLNRFKMLWIAGESINQCWCNCWEFVVRKGSNFIGQSIAAHSELWAWWSMLAGLAWGEQIGPTSMPLPNNLS